MSTHFMTRAALQQHNSFASRQWTAAQMAAGLHRKIAHADSDRSAVEWVNSHTPPDSVHVLTRSSLQRMFKTLPDELRHPSTSSEGLLLEHIHTYQTAQRDQQNSGHTLLTAVEESLSVDWIVRQYNMNAPASPDEVRSRARGLIEQRSQKEYSNSLKGWYQSFLHRQPNLCIRIAENMPKNRLSAEQKHTNIAHFFSLLREWRHLSKSQIYAADETGLAEDGSRRQKMLVPRGVQRVYRSRMVFMNMSAFCILLMLLVIRCYQCGFSKELHMMLIWRMILHNFVAIRCTGRRRTAILPRITSSAYWSTSYGTPLSQGLYC